MRAIEHAVEGRDQGPILRSTLGRRIDRHVATQAPATVLYGRDPDATNAPSHAAPFVDHAGRRESASATCRSQPGTPTPRPQCATTGPAKTSDTSGSVAFCVNSGGARVDADVVPCFIYRCYFPSGARRDGTKVFRKDGTYLINYPDRQLQVATHFA